MKTHYRIVLICNILITIVIGGVIYIFLSPDVEFIRYLRNISGFTQYPFIHIRSNPLLKFIRNYVPDMLWAYALFLSVYVIIDNKVAKMWKILLATVVFSFFMELLQLTSFVHGTFDIFDIIAEFVAGMVAALIIKMLFFREERNEKE